jgi:hypothetical protein
MKTFLCTLAVCLLLTASFFTTQALVKEEGKRTRTAFAKALEEMAAANAPEQDNSLPKRLDALNGQLANINRRLAVLEDTFAANNAKSDEPHPDLAGEIAALRQEVKALSAAQARFNAVPGYLADLTRYLDQSFAHIEDTVSENAVPDALAASVDELTQRLDMIETLFIPLYGTLGLSLALDNAAPSPPVSASVDDRLNALSEQIDLIRQDVETLHAWLIPRAIEPEKRSR